MIQGGLDNRFITKGVVTMMRQKGAVANLSSRRARPISRFLAMPNSSSALPRRRRHRMVRHGPPRTKWPQSPPVQ